ncbi:hypothetical protein FOPG_19491 [Fusarium oxysporum f. sp. conglutinans race 2 54008]|uniref:Uncharacterized protein n=1 Tax=Fusarium oxysporum f. sp. conglutinans race 2 54008 TaxID=1089457 RepID=X0HSU1_FUSOX|nr:hypothetical protein FOPG_19491 [Fusarium oxysporum f. sp. conglutinans race 2 54008]
MSPEELPNLSTPRHGQAGEPNTVRKVSGSTVKPKSRNLTRGSRRRSPGTLVGRSQGQESSASKLHEEPLAKRSQTASIPHPNELPPALAITVDTADTKLLPDDIPPRSATEPPQRSMQARNGPVIGLSATPRVMRLIIEGNHDQSGSTPRPDVPSIPAGFSQKYSPESSSQQSPEREAPAPEPSCQIFR